MPQQVFKKPKKWWEKEISPIASFVFLIIAMITVFLMGILFMREYVLIWIEISKIEQEVFSSQQLNYEQIDLDKELKQLQDIILP